MKTSSNVLGKIALACVAMTGLFSSCVVEDIKTAFEVSPAEAVITVTVMADQQNVSSEATITCSASDAKVEGNTITIYGNKAIKSQTVTINASWKNVSGSTNVVINDILAGGKGTYAATIILPVVKDEYSYAPVLVSSDRVSEMAYLENNGHGQVAGADHWISNDTEFILTGTVDYTIYAGGKVENVNVIADESEVNSIVESVKAGYAYSETPATYDITVSAYAKYRVFMSRTITTDNYNVVKKNLTSGEETVVGSYDVVAYTSTDIMCEEAPVNGHNSHLYHYGHGSVNHHGNSNAGGGIVFAD